MAHDPLPETPRPTLQDQLDDLKWRFDRLVQSLGSTVPPASESALREGGPRERWNMLGELAHVKGELDAANKHVKILEANRHAGIAACLRACAQIIMENRMQGPEAVAYICQYADTVMAPILNATAPPEAATATPAPPTPEASEIPKRGDIPNVRGFFPDPQLWIESLESKLQQVRMAVFTPGYLAQHQHFTDVDQALLIDTILGATGAERRETLPGKSLTRVDSCDVTCPNCCRPFVVSISIDGPWPDLPESQQVGGPTALDLEDGPNSNKKEN
jgi:hypothetical protein